MHNGTPVCLGGEFAGRNAVRMEFEGGYLKNYTQILRSYEQIEHETTVESTYDAVDQIFEKIEDTDERRREIASVLWLMTTTAATGKSSPYGF